MKLSIRRLQVSDVGGLAKLLKDFHEEVVVEYPKMDAEEIERELLFIISTLNDPRLLYLIALDGKKIIGWMFGEVISRMFGKPKHVGVARELYVVPTKRGKGVAKKLMEAAIQYAYSVGAEGLEEIGIPGSTQPRWEKLGFKPYLVNGYLGFDQADKFVDVIKKAS